MALQAGAESLWVCEGAFDALALLAAGMSRVVAIFGVQGWHWDWVREVRTLVFALDADSAGQQQWRQLARQVALRGKRVAVLPPPAYGGHNDVNDAWVAGTHAVNTWCTPAEGTGAGLCYPCGPPRGLRERVALLLAGTVTSCLRTPHGWRGRDSRGARRHQGPLTPGMTARTPEVLDVPLAHHGAGFVVL